jgi:hypothetical protein
MLLSEGDATMRDVEPANPDPTAHPPGLTLRDYFAAHAAGGILAGLVGDDAVNLRPEATAAMAFWVADALLAARESPQAGFAEG